MPTFGIDDPSLNTLNTKELYKQNKQSTTNRENEYIDPYKSMANSLQNDFQYRTPIQEPIGNVFQPYGGVKDIDERLDVEDLGDIPEARAQAQTGLERTGNALGQLLTEAAIGTPEAISYMLDFEELTNADKQAQEGFDNEVAKVLREIKEDISENIFPIYRSKQSYSDDIFERMSDPTWWASQGKTVGTSLSFILPALAAGAVTGGAGFAEIAPIVSALASRKAESVMEGNQAFQQEYDRYMKETKPDGTPYTDQEARTLAGQTASSVVKGNAALLPLDLLQYATMMKAFSPLTKMLSTAKSAVSPLAVKAFDVGVMGVLGEGAEEGYQAVVQNEAIKSVREGVTPFGTGFGDRLSEYIKDPNFQEQVIMGGLMGVGFMSAGSLYKKGEELIGKSIADKMIASKFNDPDAFTKADNKIEADILTKATVRDRFDSVHKYADAFAEKINNDTNLSPEDKEESLNKVNKLKENADFIQKAKQDIVEINPEYRDKPNSVNKYALNKYEDKKLTERIEDLTKRSQELSQAMKDPREQAVGLNNDIKALQTLKSRVNKDKKISEEEKNRYNNQIDAEIAVNNQKLEEKLTEIKANPVNTGFNVNEYAAPNTKEYRNTMEQLHGSQMLQNVLRMQLAREEKKSPEKLKEEEEAIQKEKVENIKRVEKESIIDAVNNAKTPEEVISLNESIKASKVLNDKEKEQLTNKLKTINNTVEREKETTSTVNKGGFDWGKVAEQGEVEMDEGVFTPMAEVEQPVVPDIFSMREVPPITEVPQEIKDQPQKPAPSKKAATIPAETGEVIPRSEEEYKTLESKSEQELKDKNEPYKDRVADRLSIAYRAKEGTVVNGRTKDSFDDEGIIILEKDFNQRILEPDYLKEGEILTLKVDTESEFYEANKDDINNVPIVILDSNGNKVGYVHEINWINNKTNQLTPELYEYLLSETNKVRNYFKDQLGNSSIEIQKADIEKRRQEELNERYGLSKIDAASTAYDNFRSAPELRNEYSSEEEFLQELDKEVERVSTFIDNAVKLGKSVDEIVDKLWNSTIKTKYKKTSPLRYLKINSRDALVKFIKQKVEGTTTKSYKEIVNKSSVEINAKYDAELKELKSNSSGNTSTTFTTEVKSKSPGWINQNFANARTLSEAFADKGIYDERVLFRTLSKSDNLELNVEVSNESLLHHTALAGVPVVLVPSSNGQYIAKRLKQFDIKTNPFGKEAVHNVLGIILNAVKNTNVTKKQLKDEVSKYLYNTSFGGQELASFISGTNKNLLFNIDLKEADSKTDRNIVITVKDIKDPKRYTKYKVVSNNNVLEVQELGFVKSGDETIARPKVTFNEKALGRFEEILYETLAEKYLNIHEASFKSPKNFNRLVADESYKVSQKKEDYRDFLSENKIVATPIHGVVTNTGYKSYTTQPTIEYSSSLKGKPEEKSSFEETKPIAPEGIPLIITKDMKQQLSDLKYSKKDISNMTPEEANNIINQSKSKENGISEDNEVIKEIDLKRVPKINFKNLLDDTVDELSIDRDFGKTSITSFSLINNLQTENDLISAASNIYVRYLNNFNGDEQQAIDKLFKDYTEINKAALDNKLDGGKELNEQFAYITSLIINNFEPTYNNDGTVKFVGYKDRILSNVLALKFKPKEGEEYDGSGDSEDKSAENFDADRNFKSDPEKSASARVKRALYFIEDYENGEPKVNILGQPVYRDYYTVFNTIMEATADLSIEEILPELTDLAQTNKDPNNIYKQVLDVLSKTSTNDTLENEFHTVFTKQRVLFLKLIIYPSKEANGLPNNTFYLANKSGAAGILIDQWKESHKKSEVINADGSYNKAVIKQLEKEFNAIHNTTKPLVKEEYIKRLSDLFNIIGIQVSTDALDKLYTTYTKKPKRLSSFGNIKKDATLVDFIGSMRDQYRYLIEDLKKATKVVDEDSNSVNLDIFKTQADRLNVLAKYENIVNPNNLSQSFRNGHGDVVYGFVNPHFLSNTIHEITNDINNYKRSDSFSRRATWDKTDEYKQSLKLNYFDSAVNGDSNKEAVEYEDMSPLEKEQFKASAVLNKGNKEGLFLMPTPSDKTTFALIKALKVAITKDDLVNGKLKEGTVLVDRLYNLLVQSEIDRINETAQLFREAKQNNDFSNLITSEHFVNKDANKKVIGSRGYFYLIPEMNNVFKDYLLKLSDPNQELLIPAETLTNTAKSALVAHLNKLIDTKFDKWNKIGMFNRLDHAYIKGANGIAQLYTQAEKTSNPDIVNTHAVTDYIVNSTIAYANELMLITGDPATFAKPDNNWDGTVNTWESMVDGTIINMFKRTAKDIAPGEEGLFEDNEKTYNTLFINEPKKSNKIYDDYKGTLREQLTNLKDIEFADAQKLTTLGEHVKTLCAYGRISKDQKKRILEKYKNNQDLTDAEIGLVLQPLKPVEVGRTVVSQSGKQFFVNYYIKSSSYPLIPQLTRGLDIDKLRVFMENNNIDAIVPKSAVKNGFYKPVTIFKNDRLLINEAGNLAPEGFDTSDDKLSLSPNIHSLSREYFRIQQDVPYDPDKSKTPEGSQMKKLKYSDLESDMEFYMNNTKYSGEQLKELDDKIHIKIYNDHLKELVDKLDAIKSSDNLYTLGNTSKLKQLIVKEAEKRDFDFNDLMLLDNLISGATDISTIPLFMHPALPKIEALLNSLIKNNVLVTKFPGKSFVQGTSMGFEKGIYGTKRILDQLIGKGGITFTTSKDNKNEIEFDIDKGLNYVVKKNSVGEDYVEAQVFMPWYFKESIESFVDELGVLDASKIDDNLLNLIGYRIPTQDQGSMVKLRVVGFLPKTSGDLIIVPPQMSKLMGSDFDVDKLFVHRFNYNAEFGRLNYIKPSSTNVDTLNTEELQNLSLEITHSILENTKVAERLLEPLDNNDVKDVLTKIKKLEKIDSSIVDESKPSQVGITYDGLHSSFVDINAAGKTGIGIGSVASTSHVLAQYTGLYLQKYQVGDNTIDKSVLFTDTRKNTPFTDYEGDNQIKQNSVTTGKKYDNAVSKGIFRLDRVYGIPDSTGKVKRISQVIKNIQTEAVDNAKNQRLFGMNLNKHTFNTALFLAKAGLNEEYLGFFLNQPIIKQYVAKLNEISDIGNSDYTFGKEEAIQMDLFNSFGSTKVLKVPFLLSFEEMENNISGNVDNQFQVKVLSSFISYTSTAGSLANLFRTINVDTKYLDKDISSTIKRQKDFEKDFINQPFFGNTKGLENTLQMEAKILGVDGSLELYKNLFPYKSDFFSNVIETISDMNLEDTISQKDLDTVVKSIKNSMWTLAWANKNNIDINDYRRKLLFGEDSLANRINKSKKRNKNVLIKLLVTNTSVDPNTPHTIEFPTAGSIETDFSLRMQMAWMELYNSKGVNHKLAVDLAGYVITNGNERNARDFSRFLPVDILKKEGLLDTINKSYNDILEDKQGVYLTRFMEQYFQHNPARAFKADIDAFDLYKEGNKIGNIKNADVIKPKALDDTPEYGYMPYIYIYDNGLHLFKLDGEVYYKMSLLGKSKRFITEYDLTVDNKQSIFEDNNSIKTPIVVANSNVQISEQPTVTDGGIITMNKYGFKEGAKVEDVLDSIISQSTNSGNVEVAKLLKQRINKLNDIRLSRIMPEEKRGKAIGTYHGPTRTIYLEPLAITSQSKNSKFGELTADEMFQLAFLHETIHGLTSYELNFNPNGEFAKKIDVFHKEWINKTTDERLAKYKTNTREFVAGIFTDKILQQELSGIKVEDTNFLQKIWDLIKKLVTGINVEDNTLLAQSLQASVDLFNIANPRQIVRENTVDLLSDENIVSLPMGRTKQSLISDMELYKDYLGDMTQEDIQNADEKIIAEILKKICK